MWLEILRRNIFTAHVDNGKLFIVKLLVIISL